MKNIFQNKMMGIFAVFAFSVIGLMAITTVSASAATLTWDGGGSDDNFSTAANWSGDTAPGNGDSIVLPLDVIFSGCPSDPTLTNDLDDASVTLAGVSITNDRPNDCFSALFVTGNTTKTSGNFGTVDKTIYWNTNITATAPVTIANIRSDGNLAIGSNNVTVSDARFSGISGSGNLTITDPTLGGGGGGCGLSALPFSGDGSGFSGAITVSDFASLVVSPSANDVARAASAITISGSDASIVFATDYQSNLTFDKDITIAGGYFSATQNSDNECNDPTTNTTVTLSGDISFTGPTAVYLTRANINFTGTVNGKSNIQLAEAQTGSISFADGTSLQSAMKVVTISDANDCASEIYSAGYAPNSKIIVNVDCSAEAGADANFPYQVGGILAGTGKVGHVEILSGGTVAPGLSPGTLTVASITWEEGGIYEFEVGKDASDQIKVEGSVSLGNGTIKAIRYQGYFPAVGAKYTIIDNDAADAVSGTFKDLPEGATFTSDGVIYQVSYVGGTGNDVVLTVKGVPGAPNTGFGMLTNNPIVTLIVTTASGVGILALARRRSNLAKR